MAGLYPILLLRRTHSPNSTPSLVLSLAPNPVLNLARGLVRNSQPRGLAADT